MDQLQRALAEQEALNAELKEKNRKFAIAVQEDRRRMQATIDTLKKDVEELSIKAEEAEANKVPSFSFLIIAPISYPSCCPRPVALFLVLFPSMFLLIYNFPEFEDPKRFADV